MPETDRPIQPPQPEVARPEADEPGTPALAARCLALLRLVRTRCVEGERARGEDCLRVAASVRGGARNLLHAAALDAIGHRGAGGIDLHELDELCARLGVRTPTLAPAGVLAATDAAILACAALAGEPVADAPAPPAPGDERAGRLARRQAADALLAPCPRPTRIVATLPPEAAGERGAAVVEELCQAGMDAARLNTARAGERDWPALATNLRRGERERRVPLLVTIPGPRLRTGAIEPGPGVVRIRPERDAVGHVVAPGRVRLVASEDGAPDAHSTQADVACLPLARTFLDTLQHGDRLSVTDARGRRRTLVVVAGDPRAAPRDERHALCNRSTYLTPGLPLTLEQPGSRPPEARVGELPAGERPIPLRVGDRLFLTRSQTPGRPGERDGRTPARIACTLPGVIDDLSPGARVLFDEGRLETRCVRTNEAGAELEVVRTRRATERLAADRPIHLPDTATSIPLLSERDERALAFAAAHADAVGIAFCRDAADLDLIESRLRAHLPAGRALPGLVLTVETQRMVDALDALLLGALRWAGCAVLLSRGDLAVETGSARLAQAESRVVRLAAAARVPLLYSTPALRSLVRRGRPGRSEPGDQPALLAADAAVLGSGDQTAAAVRWLDEHLREAMRV